MSVHLQIKEQINKFIEAEKLYKSLESKREELIEDVLALAEQKKDFSLEALNDVTKKMNELSKKFHFPLRKEVTKAMVLDYAEKVKNSR